MQWTDGPTLIVQQIKTDHPTPSLQKRFFRGCLEDLGMGPVYQFQQSFDAFHDTQACQTPATHIEFIIYNKRALLNLLARINKHTTRYRIYCWVLIGTPIDRSCHLYIKIANTHLITKHEVFFFFSCLKLSVHSNTGYQAPSLWEVLVQWYWWVDLIVL